MNNYIDGFVFPILKKNVEAYQRVAQSVADIWIEHGALSYFEYLKDDLSIEGTQAFNAVIKSSEEEVIIFGWVEFESREKRDEIHKLVASDPKMNALVAPLFDPSDLIFDVGRMVFGGFQSLVGARKKGG